MDLKYIRIALSFAAIISLTVSVVAAAVRPLGAAAPVTCAIPKPCALFTNTSTGAAVEGASASGTGLFGTSSSGVYYAPGVDGESSDPDGEDAGGAFGLNVMTTGVAPQYGVIAYGNGIGLAGEENSPGTSVSNSGYGVLGQDTTGTANADGDFNVGTVGASTFGTAVLGMANASPTQIFFGEEPIGVLAVSGPQSGTPGPSSIDFAGETASSNTYGLYLVNSQSRNAAFALTPYSFFSAGGTKGSFSVDFSGNEQLSGTLTTSKGGPYVRTTGASGTALMEYGDRMTAPQVEDVGEGQLANGRGYVAIDARLADTIDRHTVYHVFVTPEGDCNGLYVTQKSATGFAVRELRGGRSSLAFEYRIVAKPLDENGARLALAPPLKAMDGVGIGRKATGTSSFPSSPQERLKRRLGPQAYARAMLELRARR